MGSDRRALRSPNRKYWPWWYMAYAFTRVCLSRSGRLLDGQEWSQVPEELQR